MTLETRGVPHLCTQDPGFDFGLGLVSFLAAFESFFSEDFVSALFLSAAAAFLYESLR